MKKNILGALYIMKQMNIKPNYSALSREYGLDRHTIKKYHKEGGIKRKTTIRKSKYDPYTKEFEEILSNPGITIKAAYEYIRNKHITEEKTFEITYNGIRTYLWSKGIKPLKKNRTPHVRYETLPGEQLQMDWKENIQMISKCGEVLEFNILSCTLGYSRLHTFVYSETRTYEDLIRCILETLRQIGGLPKVILTDNMPSLVKIENHRRKKHEKVRQFEKDIGIEIRLCKVRSPQTKGKDESCNRFLNWLKPYNYQFENKEELLTILTTINKRVNEQINQTTKIPPIKLFQKEKESLRPLPNHVFLESYIQQVHTQVVPQTLLVRYLGKEYSVSRQFINKRVKLIPIEDKLYIYHNTSLIAIHTISAQNINYQRSHYIEAIKTSINKEEDEIEKIAIENLKLLERVGTKDE